MHESARWYCERVGHRPVRVERVGPVERRRVVVGGRVVGRAHERESGRRGHVHHPRVHGRAVVDVRRLVGRPHLERVGAARERAVRLRPAVTALDRARHRVGDELTVERVDRRADVRVPVEREGRVRVRGRARRRSERVDHRLRVDRVDHPLVELRGARVARLVLCVHRELVQRRRPDPCRSASPSRHPRPTPCSPPRNPRSADTGA